MSIDHARTPERLTLRELNGPPVQCCLRRDCASEIANLAGDMLVMSIYLMTYVWLSLKIPVNFETQKRGV